MFVARFIGEPVDEHVPDARDGPVLRGLADNEATLPLPPGTSVADGTTVFAGVRPHHLAITDDGGGIAATVSLIEHLGRNNFVVCEPRSGGADLHEAEAIQIETAADVSPEPGTELRLTAGPDYVRLFGEDGAAIPGAPTPLAQPVR